MFPAYSSGNQNQVYYDSGKQQYYTVNNGLPPLIGFNGPNRTYLGAGVGATVPKEPLFGNNLGATPAKTDFNALPQIGMTQNQPYQRPTPMPGQPSNFTPQFDMQALMQAIQARQAMMGQPRQGTLSPGVFTPGTSYGPNTGGLASLRAIAAGAPSAGQ